MASSGSAPVNETRVSKAVNDAALHPIDDDNLAAPSTPPTQDHTRTLAPDSPVELNHLPPQQQQDQTDGEGLPAATTADTDSPAQASSSIPPLDGTMAIPPPPPIPTEDTTKGKGAARSRAKSEAIGPSLDDDVPTANAGTLESSQDGGPFVLITIFLLNGNRHPFKLDQKYLKKRNVAQDGASSVDPFGISVYTLKELIWRDWRDAEWDPRPTNPGAIRLIFFGKLLDDKQTLKDARFVDTNPNVVHMTVKPQEFVDDEENAKGERSSTRGASTRWDDEGTREAGCCRCSVM